MLADEGGASNVLESWLASQREWRSLLPGTVRDELTGEAVAARIRDACAGIVAGTDERRHWVSLRAALGSLPPSSRTIEVVEPVLAHVDMSEYLQRDALLTAVAVDAMRSMARHVRPDTRERFEKQLIALASKVAKRTLTDEERNALSNAILGALLSCAWCQDADTRAPSLASLLQELETKAPDVFQTNPWFVLRLCETLPPQAARHFWRVRELIRRRTRV